MLGPDAAANIGLAVDALSRICWLIRNLHARGRAPISNSARVAWGPSFRQPNLARYWVRTGLHHTIPPPPFPTRNECPYKAGDDLKFRTSSRAR
jgi:hypothetical protein